MTDKNCNIPANIEGSASSDCYVTEPMIPGHKYRWSWDKWNIQTDCGHVRKKFLGSRAGKYKCVEPKRPKPLIPEPLI